MLVFFLFLDSCVSVSLMTNFLNQLNKFSWFHVILFLRFLLQRVKFSISTWCFDKVSLWWFFGFLVVNTAEKKYLAALFGESLHAIPQLLRLLLKAYSRKP